MNDREILEELCVDQPWSSSWEGLDDCCIFCGSGAMEYGSVEGVKYWHEDTCAWIKAMAHLGREHPEHGQFANRPKPKPKPCSVCAADPNSTLDSHVAHLSREWARWKEKVLERRMKGPLRD